MFGAGGGTSSYREAEDTDLIVLWGSNARETHPIFFHHVLKAVHKGARLYAIDPRRTSSAEWADSWLGLDVGSDIALANAMAREIIAAGLENREFIERATVDFDAYKAKVESYTLEYAERETGVPAEAIRELAHAFATAPRAMICWTLGITEHHNAVDNVLALISLVLLTGHVGRYGSGVNPLRGQNNVQGGGDMGALPDRLPGFQHVENDELRAKFDAAWGVTVPPQRGWHLSGMFDAMERGDLTAVYCIGENPVQSEADQKRAIHLLEGLDLLVVQDLFLTKTAELADVVLPATAAWAESEGTVTNSERRVQRVRAAVAPPPGARDDLAIIFELANRMGAAWGEAEAEDGLGRGPAPVAGPCRDELPPARGARRDPVAVLRRGPPGRAVPALAPVGGPGARQPRAVRAGGPRSARRQAHRPSTRSGSRPGGGWTRTTPASRAAGYTSPLRRGESLDISPEDLATLRAGRRRAGAGRLAPRPGRGAGPARRVAPAGPHVHDPALPGRRRDEPADDRRHGPEVRHGRVQGDGHPHREARGAGPRLTPHSTGIGHRMADDPTSGRGGPTGSPTARAAVASRSWRDDARRLKLQESESPGRLRHIAIASTRCKLCASPFDRARTLRSCASIDLAGPWATQHQHRCGSWFVQLDERAAVRRDSSSAC